jgi:hypothetical protein
MRVSISYRRIISQAVMEDMSYHAFEMNQGKRFS